MYTKNNFFIHKTIYLLLINEYICVHKYKVKNNKVDEKIDKRSQSIRYDMFCLDSIKFTF